MDPSLQTRRHSLYDKKALSRAEQWMAYLPFKKAFYQRTLDSAISAEELCQAKNMKNLVFSSCKTKQVERYFIWLIKLGVLRREVDGQGLTNRVRLTPLGRIIISRGEAELRRTKTIAKIIMNIKSHRYIR